MSWNPIDSAPLRDAVLVYHASYWTRLACKHEDGNWWAWPGPIDKEPMAYQPTHWAPIPDAPTIGTSRP